MHRVTIDGTLTMLSALIDWRDDSARCHAVFKSTDGTALEVEYRVTLSDPLLKTLAHGFVCAGIPLLRAPEVPVPLPTKSFAMDGSPKIDRRRKEWREVQRAAEAQRLAAAAAASPTKRAGEKPPEEP